MSMEFEQAVGTSRIAPYLPDDPGLLAHCKRVAYLTRLISHPFQIELPMREAIEDAALGHHCVLLQLGDDALHRLQQDLDVKLPSGELRDLEKLDEISAIIRAEDRDHLDERRKIGHEILDACNCLDESVELSPYDGLSIREILDDFGLSSFTSFHRLVGVVLRNKWMQFDGLDALRQIDQLPVAPRHARRLLALTDGDATVTDLESIARTDQVLAATLISRANSALYNRVSETKSIRDAICYLGIPAARNVLLQACFQPLFASSGLQSLWSHASRAAEVAQDLAFASGKGDPAEAYLGGLVHDIGRLVIEKLPQAPRRLETELRENSFPAVYAEAISYRLDHAQLGAELLRRWRFPDSLIKAIEFHHRPEADDSVLASLLYLTEAVWQTDSTDVTGFEDLPCLMRVCKAEERTGITMDQIYEMTSEPKTHQIAAGS